MTVAVFEVPADGVDLNEQRVRVQQLKRVKVENLRASGIVTNWAATLLYDRLDKSVEQIYADCDFRDFDVADWAEKKRPAEWLCHLDQKASDWWVQSSFHSICDSVCPWNPDWPGWQAALHLITFILTATELICLAHYVSTSELGWTYWRLARILLTSLIFGLNVVRLISVGMGFDRKCPSWVAIDAYWAGAFGMINFVGIILVSRHLYIFLLFELISLIAPTLWRLLSVSFLMIDSVLSALHTYVTGEVAITLSALNGVLETYEAVTKELLAQAAPDEQLRVQLEKIHHAEKARAQLAFHSLAVEYPQVAQALRTQTVAISSLQASLNEVEHLKATGLLDQRDFAVLEAQLNDLLRQAENEQKDAEMPEMRDFLANLGWIDDMSGQLEDFLISNIVPTSLVANEVLFNYGDKTNGLYILRSGAAMWEVPTGQSGFMVAGAPVGDVGVLFGEPRSATVTARTACLFYFLPMEAVQNAMRNFGRFKDRLVRHYIVVKAADLLRRNHSGWTDIQLRRYVDSGVAMEVATKEKFQPVSHAEILLVRGRLRVAPGQEYIEGPVMLSANHTYHNDIEGQKCYCIAIKKGE